MFVYLFTDTNCCIFFYYNLKHILAQFDLFAAVGSWNVSTLHQFLTPIHCTDPLLLCTLKPCNLFHFTALCPLLYFTAFTINILVKAGLMLYQRTGKGPHLIFFKMLRGNRLSCRQAIPSLTFLVQAKPKPGSYFYCCSDPKPSPAQILIFVSSQRQA